MKCLTSILYCREQNREKEIHSMKPQEYQSLALRTLNPKLTYEQRLGNGAMGIAGEAGEIVDQIKKFLYHGQSKPLDVEKLKGELGDLLWYVSLLLTQLDLTFEEVM